MGEARASTKIADRIRDLRHRSTVSQQTLADYAAISKKTIERIESGTQNPTVFMLIQIATALGTTAADLVADLSEADLPPGRRPHPVAGALRATGERAAG